MLLRIAVLALVGGVSFWLSLLPEGKPLTWLRVEHAVGVFGVVLVGNVLLGMAAAEVGRRRHWDPRQCRYTAIPLTLLGALVGIQGLGTPWGPWLAALCCCGWVSGVVCRKLVHPELGWMDSDPEEPELRLR
jgi:hypothetical protein